MTNDEQQALAWFCPSYPVGELPKRADDSINFEVLCGEFLVEGASFIEVNADYNKLPLHLKRV